MGYMACYLLKNLWIADFLMEGETADELWVGTTLTLWIWIARNKSPSQALPKPLLFVFRHKSIYFIICAHHHSAFSAKTEFFSSSILKY
jgi:hypothetical protein